MEQNPDKLRELVELFYQLPESEREEFLMSILNEDGEVNILSLFDDTIQRSHLPGYVDLEEIEKFLRKK